MSSGKPVRTPLLPVPAQAYQHDSPPELYQKLQLFRGRRLSNLIIPRNNTLTYASSLFVRGVVNWNALPPEHKRVTSESVFKREFLQFWNEN